MPVIWALPYPVTLLMMRQLLLGTQVGARAGLSKRTLLYQVRTESHSAKDCMQRQSGARVFECEVTEQSCPRVQEKV